MFELDQIAQGYYLVGARKLSRNDIEIISDETVYNERFRNVTRSIEHKFKKEIFEEIEKLTTADFWNKHSFFKMLLPPDTTNFIKEKVNFRGCRTDDAMNKKIENTVEVFKNEKTADLDKMIDKHIKNINEHIQKTIDAHNSQTKDKIKTLLETGQFNDYIDSELDQSQDIEKSEKMWEQIETLKKERETLEKKIFRNRVDFYKDFYINNTKNLDQDFVTMLEKMERPHCIFE